MPHAVLDYIWSEARCQLKEERAGHSALRPASYGVVSPEGRGGRPARWWGRQGTFLPVRTDVRDPCCDAALRLIIILQCEFNYRALSTFKLHR